LWPRITLRAPEPREAVSYHNGPVSSLCPYPRGPVTPSFGGFLAVDMPENETIRVGFEEGVTESICVTPLGSSIYRLEQTPVWNPDPVVYLGDAIELELLPDGTHRFVRVVERAPLRHYDWVVSQFFVESLEYAQFGKAVEAAGGAWEGIMEGWLLVHLPETSPFDVEGELEHWIAIANAKLPTRWWEVWKRRRSGQ
jgi:hypothetical protein